MSDPTLIDHALALLLGLVVPLAGVLHQRPESEPGSFDRRARVALAWNGALSLALMGAVVAGAWWWREGSLAGLGLEPPDPDPDARRATLRLALAFLALYLGQIAWRIATPARRAATRARWERDTPFMPRTLGELPHFAVLALSAGLFEELCYRGFLVQYAGALFSHLSAGPWLAVSLPAAVFGFAHLYQGAANALFIAVMSALFGALLLVSGSLWVPIALHAGIDLVAGGLGCWLLEGERPPRDPAPDP